AQREQLNTAEQGNRNLNNQQLGDDQKGPLNKKDKNPPITNYKIISVIGDTTHVDTTLNIKKDYKFNYLRKDNFGLLMFSNIGHSYTELAKSFDKPRASTLPEFG